MYGVLSTVEVNCVLYGVLFTVAVNCVLYGVLSTIEVDCASGGVLSNFVVNCFLDRCLFACFALNLFKIFNYNTVILQPFIMKRFLIITRSCSTSNDTMYVSATVGSWQIHPPND